MDEIAKPLVITGIADPEFEALVSSALFGRGWNIVARPLDFQTLLRDITAHPTNKILLIFSVDLPGLNSENLKLLETERISKFGFADALGSPRNLPGISTRPKTGDELLAFIRGNIRSPELRSPLIRNSQNFKSKIIALGSAGNSTGTTTLAINLGQELSLFGKNSLVLDANFSSPAVATLLDLRKLSDEEYWRDISDNFSVAEIEQKNIPDFQQRISKSAAHFDFILIDLGSLSNIASDLSDRRWPSQAKIWASSFADEIHVTTSSDVLKLQRLIDLCSDLSNLKLPAKVKFFSQDSVIKEKRDDKNFKNLSFGSPGDFQYLPNDLRLCTIARKERTTLAEISEKAPLRKAIANIARQITE